MYSTETVTQGPFSSETLKISKSTAPGMCDVLDALYLGQQELAENLFARVSKGIVDDEIRRHKQGSLVGYPNVQRVISNEYDFSQAHLVHVTTRELVAFRTHPDLAGAMEISARHIGNEVGLSFTGVDRAYLVDALATTIQDREMGKYLFRWKQKYALA